VAIIYVLSIKSLSINHSIMEFTTRLLGRLAYEFTLLQPEIPTYLHIIFSALFSIFIGAHASLSKPSSAAEPAKPRKDADGDDGEEEEEAAERKMEGLSPIDAIIFPLLAGCTLAGLYFLIKWLEDPALLSQILNLHISIFGIITIFRLLKDSMGVATSYAFPSAYSRAGRVWRADQRRRKTIGVAFPSAETSSPLPGWFSTLKMPRALNDKLWSLRNILSQKLRVRAYVYKTFTASVRAGAQDLTGMMIAITAVAYFNFVDKPWWLTNLLGVSFAYNALQFMSPTTFWTGTMILSSLFVYDIYFVFFTPLMMTVATKLDIPAKLLFPRSSRPSEDSNKQPLAMLGLGDIVLPGIMIGLALRFDLYLFYLRKQRGTREEQLERKGDDERIIKADWLPATGSWGERFWIGRINSELDLKERAGVFSKTYFYASLFGYLVGLIITLGIVQFFHYGQPALLYLVPGVLGALWGTAWIKGDAQLMWEYSEAPDDKDMKSILSPVGLEDLTVRLESSAKDVLLEAGSKLRSISDEAMLKGPNRHDTCNELISFSISLPGIRGQQSSLISPSKDKEYGGDEKIAHRPTLEDELRLASEEDMRPPNVSVSPGSHAHDNTHHAEDPPGKRQKLG
jgi:minor histocompatibility antigen H13